MQVVVSEMLEVSQTPMALRNVLISMLTQSSRFPKDSIIVIPWSKVLLSGTYLSDSERSLPGMLSTVKFMTTIRNQEIRINISHQKIT